EIIEDIDARRQSEERLRLLLRASELLARSLDYDQTLGEVARLVVPAVADWCFFDLVDDESAYRRVAAANADPSNAGLAARFRRGYGPLPEARHGISHVARSGRPELVVEVDDELLLSLARDEEQLAGMRALGLASFLSVPLIARGRTIGVLTLATAESGRRLSAADLPFAEDLGRRAAAAIDNARLTIESQRHVDRLNALLEVSRQVAEAELDPRQTLRVVAEQASRRIGDGCTIRLLDEEGTALETWASFHVDPAVRLRLQQATSRPLSPVGGLHGPVVQGGHALLTPVLQREHFAAVDNDYQAYAEFAGLHSLLIVPLRGRERVIGTLALTRERTRAPYDVEDQMLAQELADRAALAVDNARLYQAAQAAVTVREEFLSIAAHELKTPLTTVKGYAQMLRRQLDRGEPQSQVLEHSADSLLRQLARLENLVTDLLDVSRIQQGQLAFRPERCDLSEIAAQVLAHFEQAPELGADHQLTLDAPAAVAGTWDPARLDQVLTNLISNALKYSPNGGEVLVRVRPRGTGAEVSVRDQGLGIAPEQQPRLFQPFARLPAAILRDGEGVSGSGLGLYICRQIVERHGGTIVVESAPGVGSTFTVRLPR
ncbi:MAG TPA: GAF domain-containing sensor histidine kinase, partial [Thermomicrobiaceae bacterium]|nr:GAF domain-containing sensor histidine kinase [Thermomicrobiaceae bacterium]